jgi:antitoxin MazE
VQISKWGNSLAVRLPKAVVDKLDLKDGDEVEVIATEQQTLEIKRTKTRAEALANLRKLRGWVPADYKFNRDEIYERDREPKE